MSPPVALIGNDLLVRGRVPCAYALWCDLVATLGIGGAAPCMQDPPAADRRKPRAPLLMYRSWRRNLKANFSWHTLP